MYIVWAGGEGCIPPIPLDPSLLPGEALHINLTVLLLFFLLFILTPPDIFAVISRL